MSDWTSLATGPGESPEERAAREERHELLIELLGAYADRELPPETTSQIDAHLVGCARCRRELSVHQAVRRRLGVEPPLAASPALRDRIAAAVAATPIPIAPPEIPERAGWTRWLRPRTLTLVVVAIALLSAGIATGASWHARRSTPVVRELAAATTSVPLLRDALLDFRRATAGDLPGRARGLEVVRSAVPFPVVPLHAPDLRLLAAWTTSLAGEPAAVLAYRWQDRLVLEYVVSEELFFQNAAIRGAVSDGRTLTANDGARGVAAWPGEATGTVLVADLPADRLARLRSALLAGTVARGAQ